MQFGQNTKKTKKSHKGVKTKSYPNYIKEFNQHKIDSKVQQVNKAKANEHKRYLKHTCSKTYLILREKITRNDINNSQRVQGPNKQTKLSTLLMMAH
jgi:hypothetical protein